MEWLSAAISAASLIVVALINRKTDVNEKKNEKRNSQRIIESRLAMSMMAASIELGDITAIALQGGHLNGNVEAAREKAAKAKTEYEKWLMDIAAENI